MKNNSKIKKESQLGEPYGTACNKLRKMILFSLIKELNKDVCFQCGLNIEEISDLSIEHKIPWLDSENAVELYFDINNIAFSHLSCNIKASRNRPMTHPSTYAYNKGCRCDGCKNENKLYKRKRRQLK